MCIRRCVFSYLVCNLVLAFLGLSVTQGESLSAMVDSQRVESIKCVGKYHSCGIKSYRLVPIILYHHSVLILVLYVYLSTHTVD